MVTTILNFRTLATKVKIKEYVYSCNKMRNGVGKECGKAVMFFMDGYIIVLTVNP